MRDVPTTISGTPRRSNDRTRTTSTDQHRVAAMISASPEPISGSPTPPASCAYPARINTIATRWGIATRSPRKSTAPIATQATSVLWMKAASLDDTRARPSKNNTNGTLPPMTATTESDAFVRDVVGVAGAAAAANARRWRCITKMAVTSTAATRFLAVV